MINAPVSRPSVLKRVAWAGVGCVAFGLLCGPGSGVAAGLGEQLNTQLLHGVRWSGRLGLYDFQRDHNLNQPFPGNPTQDPNGGYDVGSVAIGGNIYAQTGQIYGLSAGLGYSFSEALQDKEDYNSNLVGPAGHYRTLNRAYAQYNWPGVRIRAGRQNMHTPFASDDQFAFIPRSFAGFSISARPLDFATHRDRSVDPGEQRIAPADYNNDLLMPMSFHDQRQDKPKWQVYFARMYKFESRSSSHFQDGNRYVPDTSGFYTLGTHARQSTAHGDYIAQLWHYNFNDTADLQYVEAGYQLPALAVSDGFDGIKPFIRLQYTHESEAGQAKLGPIDADVYGAKLGVRSAHFGLSVVGHYSPTHEGSFRGGQVAHPYTDLSGLFYTDTMNDGVGDLGPGYGYGVRANVRATDEFSLFSRYIRYVARYGQSHDFYDTSGPQGFAANTPITHNQHSWGWDTGVTLSLSMISPVLEGFKLQDVLGVTDFEGSHRFYDNRLRLFYKF
ncbi:hypothetical protein V5738_15690 [Salinisphaera sp. SPP-AMP-43]|uniref:hypothetical protein n=1 Tax=Salinisphaera sp. SPP-AMP-43 TaxID=3121288 RepID=UPI003C6DE406